THGRVRHHAPHDAFPGGEGYGGWRWPAGRKHCRRGTIGASGSAVNSGAIRPDTWRCAWSMGRSTRRDETPEPLTLPPAEAGGFSVLRRGQRHASPKALTEPLSILRRVVIAVEACPTVRAYRPANGQAFGDDDAAARTCLAGMGRRHGDD